jgi:hypothetical protein
MKTPISLPLLSALSMLAADPSEQKDGDSPQLMRPSAVIKNLDAIRKSYLDAIASRRLDGSAEDQKMAQYFPNFPNFPNFRNWPNWFNGWRNF